MIKSATALAPLAPFALTLSLAAAPQDARPQTTEQWRDDLAFVVNQIKTTHPDHARRIPAEAFDELASKLHDDLPGLNEREAAIRMMALVASIRDGHTYLRPHQLPSFRHFVPLRFFRFSDGLFITCALPDAKDLIGVEVLRIGKYDATKALDLLATVVSSDNAWGHFEGASHLSSADVLAGLGIIDSVAELPLVIDDGSGEPREVVIRTVAPQSTRGRFDYLQARRETEWPPPGRGVTAFAALRRRQDFYSRTPEENSDLPVHARGHSAYWHQHLPEHDTVVMQINTVTRRRSAAGETFENTYKEMFRFIDENNVGKFILDLRFNTGGNGDILLPFVHELIKRDRSINRSGRLFALVGRRSFSAAVVLLGELSQHTHVILAGEPAGAPLNFFGDNTAIELPNSRMQLWVSTRYWQLSTWDDRSSHLPIEIPAEFSSTDYFGGLDPAMAAIFAMKEHRSILTLAREVGIERARSVYEDRKTTFADTPYWQPLRELEMNRLGYDLLRSKRANQAIIAFTMVAERYPNSPNAWDSLGEAQFALGRHRESLASYTRALEIDPKNRNAHGQRQMVARIESLLRKR
ncbi:MAG: tetratricopeptide repeat protein [bacterium]|nr:tetratricopeptide repeat protein [bacterium]